MANETPRCQAVNTKGRNIGHHCRRFRILTRKAEGGNVYLCQVHERELWWKNGILLQDGRILSKIDGANLESRYLVETPEDRYERLNGRGLEHRKPIPGEIAEDRDPLDIPG